MDSSRGTTSRAFVLIAMACAPVGCSLSVVGCALPALVGPWDAWVENTPLAAPLKEAVRDAASPPTALTSTAWRRAGSNSESPVYPYHWQNMELDAWFEAALLNEPDGAPDVRQRLRRWLAGDDLTAAANAAILLARLGVSEVTDSLDQAVRDTSLVAPLRAAAVEALSASPSDIALARLRSLGDELADDEAMQVYPVEVHAEWLRGMATRVDPATEPRFTTMLSAADPAIREAAVEGWSRARAADLPERLIAMRADPDARIRAAVVLALARAGHPRALEFSLAALEDFEFTVRLAAIGALGSIESDGARRPLVDLAKHRTDTVRAAAIEALAAQGADAEVLAAADDSAWRVRLVVARALAVRPDRAKAGVVRRYLADASPAVQRETIRSLNDWPAAAAPLLFEALAESVYLARQDAARLLASRWAAAADFPVDGSLSERQAALAVLRGRWMAEHGTIDRRRLNGPVPAGVAIDRDQLAVVRAVLAELTANPDSKRTDRLLADLRSLGADLAPLLEACLLDEGVAPPPVVHARLLAELDPIHATIERLATTDLETRRRAAAQVARQATDRTLPRLALARLAAIAATENDALVWRDLLTAVADDPRPPAVGMAYAALGHASPEVRRQACEHLARFPSGDHAAMLRPALGDDHAGVQLAAVRAWAAWREADPTPVEPLLAAADAKVRLEAAIGLARLGQARGRAALERMAFERDPLIRRRAAVAMGEVGDPAFVDTLVELLDDQLAVRRAALESLPKVVPEASQEQVNISGLMIEQIEFWKAWRRSHRTRLVAEEP